MTTITASNFNVTNATSQDIQSLNLALTYLQQSKTGLAILQGMISNHDTINIQHGGAAYDNYTNGQGNGTAGTINWDPNGATSVFDNSQNAIGVDSAALLLIHEGAHATDPDYATHEAQTNVPLYGTGLEQYAVGQEDLVAKDLGEVQRTNHFGANVTDPNSTDHTTSNNQWQEIEDDGNASVRDGTYTQGTTPTEGGNTATNPENGQIDVNNGTITVNPNAIETITGNGNNIILSDLDTENIVGGGNTVSSTGSNTISISNTNGTFDTLDSSNTSIKFGANSQANIGGSGNTATLTTGDSLGAYGGNNNITINAAGSSSPNDLLVVSNTNGQADTITTENNLAGGTTFNGQPVGIYFDADNKGTILGSNNSGYGTSDDSILYEPDGNFLSYNNSWSATGTNVTMEEGAPGNQTNIYTGLTITGSDNTLHTTGTSVVNITGTQNIADVNYAKVNITDAGTENSVNGSYDNIYETTSDTVNINGSNDTNTGGPTDDVTFYGGDYVGDVSSGVGATDEGGTPSEGGGDGYGGYGYGYDFIKGKLPQSTTNIVSIAGFDKSVSAVAAATTSASDGETINNARSKALQSATDSASGTSTLGDTLEGLRWNTSVVTWNFGSTAFNAQEQSAIESAFSAWSAVSGVKFEQVAEGQSSDIALNFNNLDTASSGVIGFTSYKSADGSFAAGTTIDLEDPADTALTNGQNGQLTYSGTGVSLYQVALHEIGHALGLNDTSDVNSAMYYGSSSSNQQLDATDIANIQLLYGSPTAPLNVVSTTSTTATSGKDASAPNAASAARGSEHTQAALHTASDGSVNQLIQSIAAFNGSSSAASSPSLLSPDEHPMHLASVYRLSA